MCSGGVVIDSNQNFTLTGINIVVLQKEEVSQLILNYSQLILKLWSSNCKLKASYTYKITCNKLNVSCSCIFTVLIVKSLNTYFTRVDINMLCYAYVYKTCFV